MVSLFPAFFFFVFQCECLVISRSVHAFVTVGDVEEEIFFVVLLDGREKYELRFNAAFRLVGYYDVRRVTMTSDRLLWRQNLEFLRDVFTLCPPPQKKGKVGLSPSIQNTIK